MRGLANRLAMMGSGTDPFANTYIHFEESSCIDFYPYFENGGSWEVSVESDCALGYTSGNRYVYMFDSSTGSVGTGFAGLSSLIKIASMEWGKNWKLNGNDSDSVYNPTQDAVADSRALTSISRGKYRVGIEPFDGGYRVYHDFDGVRQLSGPKFSSMANAWCVGSGTKVSCFGTCLIRLSSSMYAGAPFDAYGYVFKQGGLVVHKLVPAKDSLGQGCLYDEITSTFHKVSQGTVTINGDPKYIET